LERSRILAAWLISKRFKSSRAASKLWRDCLSGAVRRTRQEEEA
jgi:hypothetical protein